MTVDARTTQSAIDFHGLNQLRQQAGQAQKNDEQTLRQVAAQFESLFVTMMLKSMRQASLGDGIFDSNQSKMYQDMADQQLASDLSVNGGLGLQDMIMRQLGGDRYASDKPAQAGQSYSIDTVTVRPSLGIRVNEEIIAQIRDVRDKQEAEDTVTPAKTNAVKSPVPEQFDTPSDFVEKLWPYAQKAADKLGVAPEVILSQAALETGWGQYVLKNREGSSHNLFNIKAHGGWNGDTISKKALEFRDGKALQQASEFRAYQDYQQSFDDYVDFLQTQPRYQKALQQVGDPEKFVEELHKAGYATDPLYADKIKRIMNSDTLAQISLDNSYL